MWPPRRRRRAEARGSPAADDGRAAASRADAPEAAQTFVYLQPAPGMFSTGSRHEVPANKARTPRVSRELQLRLALGPVRNAGHPGIRRDDQRC